MNPIQGNRRRRGFTIKDLAVVLTMLVVAAGLVASLAGTNRDLSRDSVCAANQQSLFGGLTAYVNTYNSYPPHNPRPTYAPSETVNGVSTGGWDPNLGWVLTYGLGLTPPETFPGGHFKWHVLEPDELPDVVVCPAADHSKLFSPNPEIDTNNLESFVFRYAAFYQTSGTFRSALQVKSLGLASGGSGGRNPVIPDPTGGFSQPFDNAVWPVPSVWVARKPANALPEDPTFSAETNCYVQAVHPAEVQEPSRAYYLADTQEYRPMPRGATYDWPPAAINDGWLSGWGNRIFLGTRHYGYANVLYLDGRVSRDNQAHPFAQWNMNYDASTGQALSDQWRCATFATDIPIANISTQVHTMPVLMAIGWEYFFDADGVAVK